MNIIFSRIGDSLIFKILNICGFSFTFAMTREKSALLGVNFIDRSLRKIVSTACGVALC